MEEYIKKQNAGSSRDGRVREGGGEWGQICKRLKSAPLMSPTRFLGGKNRVKGYGRGGLISKRGGCKGGKAQKFPLNRSENS